MNDAHRTMREALGAWVLGSLDGGERQAVEAHVATCEACREEVAALSALPGLLGRVTVEEVEDSRLVPSPDLPMRLVARAAESEQALRVRLTRWRLAAGVAAATALVAMAGLLVVEPAATGGVSEADRLVAPAAAVAEDAATSGQVAALAWEWGTTVELDVADLPVREAYSMWAVADTGEREQAGAWGLTESRRARVYGASSIQRDDLERLEITDTDGEVLVAFDFDRAVLEPGG